MPLIASNSVSVVGRAAAMSRMVASPATTYAGTPACDDDGLLDGDSLPWLAESFDNSELLFGLYTAVIFGLAVATIMAGQYYAKPVLVNIGYAMVSVILFALYVGRIAGELPTSLAVIGGGLALISGAIFLERRRRGAISTMAPGGVQ